MLLSQVHSLLVSRAKAPSPLKLFEDAKEKRQVAYLQLKKLAEQGRFASQFEKAFHLVKNLFCYRERPKFELIRIISFLRAEYLAIADEMLKKGLIDKVMEVFDLKVENLVDFDELKLSSRKQLQEARAH